jgi:hypothetical protein
MDKETSSRDAEMSRRSKLRAFMHDVAVLTIVVGGLGLACELGDGNAAGTSGAAARVPAQATMSIGSTEANSWGREQQRKTSGAAPAAPQIETPPRETSAPHHRFAALAPARLL